MLLPTLANGISCRAKKEQSRSAVSFSSLEKDGVAINSFKRTMASDCNASIIGLFITNGCAGCSGNELIQFFAFADDHLVHPLFDGCKSVIQFGYHAGKNFIRVFKFKVISGL